MSAQIFTLKYPWDKNGYCPKTEIHLYMDRKGFYIRTIVEEKNPRRQETKHQHDVYKDSCTEWFVNFLPEKCEWYFNFEVNANGAMFASFRRDRENFCLLSEDEIEKLHIQAAVGQESWEISYCVPFSLIQSYIPEFCCRNSMRIKANFYKCGDETLFPHFGMWNVYEADPPDFHRPEHFGWITVNME